MATAADGNGAGLGQARAGGPVLSHAGRYARAARRGDRPLRGGWRRRARHQADQGARRADDRAGSGRGRARRHAAHRRSTPAWSTGCCASRRCPRGSSNIIDKPGACSCRRRRARSRRGAADSRERWRGSAARCAVISAHATGRDFSYYKRATILRRISRRMQVNGVTTCRRISLSCARTPARRARCSQDLLISVTNFFRDRDAFEALEARIPELFAGKGPGDVGARLDRRLRHRRGGLFDRHAAAANTPARSMTPPAIQVFAHRSRRGGDRRGARRRSIPITITADVSEERLRRFFVKEHRGYRVAARAARDGALRRARSAEGCAVFAARSRHLPQSAHLPDPRGAAACVRDLPLRAARRRAALPRHVRDGG